MTNVYQADFFQATLIPPIGPISAHWPYLRKEKCWLRATGTRESVVLACDSAESPVP
jgi:hypothetical protein